MSDLPKLPVTTPKDITDKVVVPKKVPIPPKVSLPDTPDWMAQVGLTIWEKLQKVFQAIFSGTQTAIKVVSDVAKITTFIQMWWIPLVAMIAILILLVVLKVL
jgi:hypothetical protein